MSKLANQTKSMHTLFLKKNPIESPDKVQKSGIHPFIDATKGISSLRQMARDVFYKPQLLSPSNLQLMNSFQNSSTFNNNERSQQSEVDFTPPKRNEAHARNSSISSSDEPNLVIYNLIKEIDYILESNNFYSAQ